MDIVERDIIERLRKPTHIAALLHADRKEAVKEIERLRADREGQEIVIKQKYDEIDRLRREMSDLERRHKRCLGRAFRLEAVIKRLVGLDQAVSLSVDTKPDSV
jgi:predicted nuclease with TOPRIM domain